MKTNIKFLLILIIGLTTRPNINYSQSTSINKLIEDLNNGCGFFSSYQIDRDDFMRYENIEKNEYEILNNVGLQLILSNSIISKENLTSILQITISASQINDSITTPLNVCFVVDRSASMNEYKRMEKVKKALKEFFKMLRPSDFASIVLYDDCATILLTAQLINKEKQESVLTLIDSIKLGKSTNTYSGIIAGIKEVQKNFNPEFANHIILLTDGITNRGITDPEEILKQIKIFYNKGITISTIGVGTDINFSLLHNIAKKGYGLSHFIGDCDSVKNDIVRVFKDEFKNMLAEVKNATIEIEYPKYFTGNSLTHDNYKLGKNSISIPIKNLYQGTSQICLVEVSKKNRKRLKSANIKVKLKYFDALKQKKLSLQEQKQLHYSDTEKYRNKKFVNKDIEYNYYIALMVNSLKESIQESETRQYYKALKTINSCLLKLEKEIPLTSKSSRTYLVYQILLYQKKQLQRKLSYN